MTHMPFLTRDKCGRRVLFLCRAGSPPPDRGRIWKLHFQRDGENPRRLETGLGDEVVECSPAAWVDETGWHVTFIAGGATENPVFRLHRMDGPTLHQLGRPTMAHAPTRAGFAYNKRLVHAEPEDFIHVIEPAGDRVIELRGSLIYRVTYKAEDPDILLISGLVKTQAEVFTIEHDLRTGEQELIECDGRPAYKCTILGDEVLYAERFGEGFEDRRIVAAKSTRRIALEHGVAMRN